jgi:hypothetical protein
MEKTTQTNAITASGIFTVTVTNSGGCLGVSLPVTVTEYILPNPTVTAVGPTTYCLGAGTFLTTIPGYGYQWIKGSANVAGATNQNYTPTAGATYKVKISDTHGCEKTSTSGLKVTVNSNPTASISASGSLNICGTQTKTINANSGTGLTYQWKKNGINISGSTAGSYVATTAGDYQCVVTNSSGCSTTSNILTITSNCKGDEGVDESESISWHIFPNPAQTELHVQLSVGDAEDDTYILEIHNILGEIMMRSEGQFVDAKISENIRLDKSLAGGIYFVVVKYGERMQRERFLVAH